MGNLRSAQRKLNKRNVWLAQEVARQRIILARKAVEDRCKKDAEFAADVIKAVGDNLPKEIKPSGIFEEKIPGGNLNDRSDALDALNIGIKAEDNSIKLYTKLSQASFQPDTIKLFKQLIEEERMHRSILENEVEFVTETGEFHDFKTVTM